MFILIINKGYKRKKDKRKEFKKLEEEDERVLRMIVALLFGVFCVQKTRSNNIKSQKD